MAAGGQLELETGSPAPVVRRAGKDLGGGNLILEIVQEVRDRSRERRGLRGRGPLHSRGQRSPTELLSRAEAQNDCTSRFVVLYRDPQLTPYGDGRTQLRSGPSGELVRLEHDL